jgi:hypothetical protein
MNLAITLACIAGFTGVCWILFVKLWPEPPKREESALEWPDHIFKGKK